jgi:hypothetical protein
MNTPSHLGECIVAASTIGSNVIIAKNRDRSYNPQVEIVRRLVDNTEVCLFHDMTTGWVEGMNEHGIGILNTALMVGFDEKEKQLVKKSGQKSQDAPRVMAALGHKDLKGAIKSAAGFDGGIKGHTIVANARQGAVIENTSRHAVSIKPLNMEDITVRTNHGHLYTDAGYTEGIKYLSSKIRKISAEKQLSAVNDYHDIARALRQPFYPKNSMLNMARDTAEMSTTSQIVLNLNTNEMLVYLFRSKIEEFHGLNNQLPEGRQSKIKVRVFWINNR